MPSTLIISRPASKQMGMRQLLTARKVVLPSESRSTIATEQAPQRGLEYLPIRASNRGSHRPQVRLRRECAQPGFAPRGQVLPGDLDAAGQLGVADAVSLPVLLD